MSDRDVLKRAAEALREETAPSPDELRALRARVLSGNVKPLAPRSSVRRLRWILPMAAALVAGSALAATPGGFAGVLDAAERFLKLEWLAPAHEARRDTSEPKLLKPRPAQPPAVVNAAPEIAEAVVEKTSEPAPSPVLEPSVSEPRRERKKALREPANVKPSGPSLDLTLYRAAHDLHFRQRDYPAALQHWDDYLARMPKGTFTVEAQYNRALCLLRLGRYAEARSALMPFAEGTSQGSGNYRRGEAQRLIEALDKRP